jgi:hypothetical protein
VEVFTRAAESEVVSVSVESEFESESSPVSSSAKTKFVAQKIARKNAAIFNFQFRKTYFENSPADFNKNFPAREN